MATVTQISKPKPKKTKYRKIDIEADGEPWAVLSGQLGHECHADLAPAEIQLVWMVDVKPNKFGKEKWGECRKVPALWRLFTEADLVIGLNKEFWDLATDEQKAYLVDHELCHAAPDIDEKTGEQKRDDQDRRQWCIVPHDVEEFAGPVERHGIRKADLQAFFEVAEDANLRLPFAYDGRQHLVAAKG